MLTLKLIEDDNPQGGYEGTNKNANIDFAISPKAEEEPGYILDVFRLDEEDHDKAFIQSVEHPTLEEALADVLTWNNRGE